MADLRMIRKITKTNTPIRPNELIVLDETLQMSDEDFDLVIEMLENMVDRKTLRLKVFKKQ